MWTAAWWMGTGHEYNKEKTGEKSLRCLCTRLCNNLTISMGEGTVWVLSVISLPLPLSSCLWCYHFSSSFKVILHLCVFLCPLPRVWGRQILCDLSLIKCGMCVRISRGLHELVVCSLQVLPLIRGEGSLGKCSLPGAHFLRINRQNPPTVKYLKFLLMNL